MNSLDSLGTLYLIEGDFAQITVSKMDKSRMSEFLRRDKGLLNSMLQYAIRDAVIY